MQTEKLPFLGSLFGPISGRSRGSKAWTTAQERACSRGESRLAFGGIRHVIFYFPLESTFMGVDVNMNMWVSAYQDPF